MGSIQVWSAEKSGEFSHEPRKHSKKVPGNILIHKDFYCTGTISQDFDLDEAFGAVAPGNIDGVIELKARMNQNAVYEFNVKVRRLGRASNQGTGKPLKKLTYCFG